jgi:hypothetical protein
VRAVAPPRGGDLNLNLVRFLFLFFIFILFKKLYLLVLRYAADRCGMVCSDEYHDRNRRSVTEDYTDQVLGGRTIERSGGALHRARGDEKHGFLG